MNNIRKQRLFNVFLIILLSSLGVFFILKALNSNLDYFYTPSEALIANIPQDKRIKIGGMVKKDSVDRNGTKVIFKITDFENTIEVHYEGVIPDLFKEGSGVVAYGKIHDKTLIAENIFAKHDENYMPPNIEISSG